jgi:hypothetical protein
MGGLSASGTALGNGGHARRRSQPSSMIGRFSFTVAGFCLSLKPVVIEHRRSRNVARMDPWEGTPRFPPLSPSSGSTISSTSCELDGVSGTYGPSYVGRRVSRQQINQLPPTPRGATNWSPPLGRTIAKISQRLDFTSPSLFRKLNDISLCPPRFLRGEAWRNLQEAPTARRSGLLPCWRTQAEPHFA